MKNNWFFTEKLLQKKGVSSEDKTIFYNIVISDDTISLSKEIMIIILSREKAEIDSLVEKLNQLLSRETHWLRLKSSLNSIPLDGKEGTIKKLSYFWEKAKKTITFEKK